MTKIAVLVSGGGTNLQALIDARQSFHDGELALVVSSNPGAYALERAKAAGIPAMTVDPKTYGAREEYDAALCETLAAREIGLVVLAGFLRVLGPKILAAYGDRIINVHPSLIPSFCGRGFYGLRVHEAALKAGVKVTGATVHLVNEIVDGGKILLQKAVDVLPEDTPESLQQRVMREADWTLLPEAVRMFCEDRIKPPRR
jgi:phosphoribosylglycinamide formyltransferase-1